MFCRKYWKCQKLQSSIIHYALKSACRFKQVKASKRAAFRFPPCVSIIIAYQRRRELSAHGALCARSTNFVQKLRCFQIAFNRSDFGFSIEFEPEGLGSSTIRQNDRQMKRFDWFFLDKSISLIVQPWNAKVRTKKLRSVWKIS